MKLTYTHWKHGRVEREVEPVPGLRNHYADGATVYEIGTQRSLYHVGHMLGDRARLASPVRVGWDAKVTQDLTVE